MAFMNGKIPFMNAIAEIDKAGRLVVPKKMRDALHLEPGTRLTLHQEGGTITLQPENKPRGLYREDGMLVYDTGPLPPEHVNWVDDAREERERQMMGAWTNP
jgi:AbrB family looped-hinge helix DNA binding protein